MKLSMAAVFGVGYVLGSRAGRQRYDQLRRLAGRLAGELEHADVRQRLESFSTRLEAYARDNRHAADVGARRAQTSD